MSSPWLGRDPQLDKPRLGKESLTEHCHSALSNWQIGTEPVVVDFTGRKYTDMLVMKTPEGKCALLTFWRIPHEDRWEAAQKMLDPHIGGSVTCNRSTSSGR